MVITILVMMFMPIPFSILVLLSHALSFGLPHSLPEHRLLFFICLHRSFPHDLLILHKL